MKPKLIIYGAGDNGNKFAQDYRSLGRKNHFNLIGFVDDYREGQFSGFPILGKKKDLPNLRKQGIENIIVTLFGNPVRRLETCLEIERMGYSFPSLHHDIPDKTKIGKGVYIHPTAVLLGFDQELGDFSVVGPYATIEGRIKTGKGVVFCPYTFIGHSSVIGDGTVFYPRSTCLPNTNIGKKCIVGPNALVRGKVDDHRSVLRYRINHSLLNV